MSILYNLDPKLGNLGPSHREGAVWDDGRTLLLHCRCNGSSTLFSLSEIPLPLSLSGSNLDPPRSVLGSLHFRSGIEKEE